MRPILLAPLALLLLSGCTFSDQRVREVLTGAGYSEIEVGGHAYFECGEEDTFSNTFVAVQNGHVVEGVVCGGVLKTPTVRVSRSYPKAPAAANRFEAMADSLIRARQAESRRVLVDSLRAAHQGAQS